MKYGSAAFVERIPSFAEAGLNESNAMAENKLPIALFIEGVLLVNGSKRGARRCRLVPNANSKCSQIVSVRFHVFFEIFRNKAKRVSAIICNRLRAELLANQESKKSRQGSI